MKYFLTLAILLACEQSTAEADAPPQPACVFENRPQNIFCAGQFGEKCFVCYYNGLPGNTQTECWPFERQRCYQP